MPKVNWDTATPAQAQKMRDLIGENQAWAKAHPDVVARGNQDDQQDKKRPR